MMIVALVVAALIAVQTGGLMFADNAPCAGGTHQYRELEHRDATATTDGYRVYICTVCGRTYTDFVLAYEHVWSAWQVARAATCTEPGVLTRRCTQGGGHEETQAIPPLGHSYIVTENGDRREFVCVVCGDAYSEAVSVVADEPTLEPTVAPSVPLPVPTQEPTAASAAAPAEWRLTALDAVIAAANGVLAAAFAAAIASDASLLRWDKRQKRKLLARKGGDFVDFM